MKVYGPYTRKDGRQHVIIVENQLKRTISYPKWLLLEEGYIFNEHDTVDHIDGDYTNNSLSNLQIISRSQNSSKKYEDFPELKEKHIFLICFFCEKEFKRTMRRYREQLKKNKHKGYSFCSRSCQGKIFN